MTTSLPAREAPAATSLGSRTGHDYTLYWGDEVPLGWEDDVELLWAVPTALSVRTAGSAISLPVRS